MKQLAGIISAEAGVGVESIMLLRHSNESIAKLRRCGASVEEYTAIQPVDSRYDFHKAGTTPVEIVVVIVEDRVFGVYRVRGVSKRGTNYDLTSEEYQRFDATRGKPVIACKCFDLQRIPSAAVDATVTGWTRRTRTPVQRSTDSFFSEIEIAVAIDSPTLDDIRSDFERRVKRGAGALACGKGGPA